MVVLGLSVRLRSTLCCECGCCSDCDACTVGCVAYVCCEGDGNAGVGSGGRVVVVSAYGWYTWFRCFV